MIVAQVAFTYLPLMQMVFDTRAVSLSDGAVVVATGIVLLLILEAEKRLWPRPRHPAPAPRHG